MTHLLLPLFFALFFCVGCSAPPQEPMLSRSPEIASLPSPKPLPEHKETTVRKTLVFLDAGHGGTDPGTRAKNGRRFQEKTLNLETVRRVERYLLQWGYRVAMSRRNDVSVPLLQRVQMATKDRADIFVSIHFNSAPNTSIHGSEIFYYHAPKAIERTKSSKRLGACILKRLCEVPHLTSRGVKHGNLCVIRETKMAAVLVESAFLSNAQELKRVSTPAFRQKIAWAIAKGIDDYFSIQEGQCPRRGSNARPVA